MYEVSYSSKFKTSVKRCRKQGKDLTLLWDTVKLLTVDGNDYFLSYNRVPCMKVEFF